jgi:hypothetical protein
LHSLAQTHFVCQDAANTVIVQADQPVEAFQLVLTQRAVLQAGRLHGKAQIVGIHILARGLRLGSLHQNVIFSFL